MLAVNPDLVINLYDIQPGEDRIARESVEYFIKHPKRLFRTRPQIRIFSCAKERFKYFAIDDNTRLYACHKLGITDIPLKPVTFPHPDYGNLPWSTVALTPRLLYRKNIRTWADLEHKMVSAEKKDLGLYP